MGQTLLVMPPVKKRIDPRAAAVIDAIGARLKFRREQCNISQKGLAALAKVDPTAIPRIENGARKTELVNFISLARALGCSPAWLVFGEGELPPPIEVDPVYQDQRRR